MDVGHARLQFLQALAAEAESPRSASFDALLKWAFSALQKLLPCDRLSVSFVHEDSETLIAGPVFSRKKIRFDTGTRLPLSGTRVPELLKHNRIAIVDDLPLFARAEPDSPEAQWANEGFLSSLSVPLLSSEAPPGMLNVASLRRKAYSREMEPFARLIAGQFAAVLGRSRLASRALIDRGAKSRLQDENTQLRGALTLPSAEIPGLIGASPPWRRMLQKMALVAKSDATVLIRGETGTGKELVARAIHGFSSRKDRPFVAVNCGVLSPELIASELFGHERGAFTGAIQKRLGRIELAQGGTLFLDEVAELRPEVQVKLLRVLQEREFERVGGTASIRTDVRVIAATHRNLEQARAEFHFRDDLFFRLNVFPLIVPPLRERKEDLEPLLSHFLARFSQKLNKSFEAIDPQALEQCLLYHWPGNVRELENLVERCVILSPGPVLYMDPLLEAEHLSASAPTSLELDTVIAAHLSRVLKMTRGKVYGQDGAAKLLGLKPSTLQAKMRKLGVARISAGRGDAIRPAKL